MCRNAIIELMILCIVMHCNIEMDGCSANKELRLSTHLEDCSHVVDLEFFSRYLLRPKSRRLEMHQFDFSDPMPFMQRFIQF